MRSGKRWAVAAGGGTALLAATAAGAWLTWSAGQARAELTAARAQLPAVRSAVLTGDGDAGTALAALRRHADAAHDDTHDAVWAVAGAVPWLGSPFATVRGLTESVRELADEGLPALSTAADRAHPQDLLSESGLDTAALAAAAEPLQRAAGVIGTQREAVARLSPSWMGQVSEARAQLLGQLDELGSTSRAAATAARVLPPMLGGQGVRRYFVGFQNPAEARGTGGLLDAYAVIRVDHGALTVERTGANTQLPPLTGNVDGVSADFADRYGAQGGDSMWANANMSPDFPEVATAWEAMWLAGTGQQVDGAVALNPRTLAAILAATGPVTAPVVGTVDAARVEELVLHEQYRNAALSGDQRKSLMLGVGTAALDRLTHGKVDPLRLVAGLSAARAAGNVMVHSRTAAEQQELIGAGLAGQVSREDGPFAQAVVVNAAGNKLDSWLGETLDYRVDHCSATGRQVTVKVTLSNGAPTKGLPDYVTVRSDLPSTTTVPGQNRTGLHVLLARGATVTKAVLDGQLVPMAPAPGALPEELPDDDAGMFLESTTTAGRPSVGLELETAPGQNRVLELSVVEPASSKPPVLPTQSMVRPVRVTSELAGCRASGRG